MKEILEQRVTKALENLGLKDVAFTIEFPSDITHGDFATNVALVAAKAAKENPKELAKKIVTELETIEHISTITIAGPGFINFSLSRDYFVKTINTITSNWGKNESYLNKRVMVEHTQPNPFKEMHIGHLMSNIIGESIARLIEFSGATIVRANYQGDVGPHVAKALWGLQDRGIKEPGNAAELGKAYTHGTRAYDESEKAKEEIDHINVAVYTKSDPELMELWRKGRDVSLQAFEEIYRILGSKFDYYFFESESAEPGTQIVRDGVTRGVFEESDGAVIYRGEKKGLHTLVFLTSKGTPTYEAKEIGLAFLKEERWPSDLSLITTSTEQIGHFNVVKAALEEIAPLLGQKTHHIAHGFLRLASGKMSSREGNIITASSLIRDVLTRVSEKNPDPIVAEQVGLSAIKYSILKQSAGSDIIFDFNTSLSLEGDSGPYLQYATVRAQSILRGTPQSGRTEETPHEAYLLERLLVRFPEIVARAQNERAPHHITQYLTMLSGEWNSFYAKERIIGDTYESYKLTLAQAFVHTMKNGLWLLGISVPERM